MPKLQLIHGDNLQEKRKEFAKKYGEVLPKSLCTCGHTGDGVGSDHATVLLPGSGACMEDDCSCDHFHWAGWTPEFEKALKKTEKA